MGNRIAEDLASCLVRAFRNVSCSAPLDIKHQFPNVSERYIVDEFVTEGREDVGFQAQPNVVGMARRLAD
jgi:hypothetical protein